MTDDDEVRALFDTARTHFGRSISTAIIDALVDRTTGPSTLARP